MNAKKFEQLIQRFFGEVCLEIDVFDNNGIRHRPREWFIAPLKVIERAIFLLDSGEIINVEYKKSLKIKNPDFIWLNFSQIKKLNLKKGVLNPFVKTILFMI